MKVEVTKKCPFCRNETKLRVDQVKLDMFNQGVNIMHLFVSESPFFRETLLTGMCSDCQEKTFNRPAPGHEADWGEEIGECETCGAPLWSIRNRLADGTIQCTSCLTVHNS